MMTLAINQAYKDHNDPHRKALEKFKRDEDLSREEIRLVEQAFPTLLQALKQVTGVFVK